MLLSDLGDLLNLLVNVWGTGAATLAEYLTGRKNDPSKTYRKKGLVKGTLIYFGIPTAVLLLAIIFSFGIPLAALVWAVLGVLFLVLWTPIGVVAELVFEKKFKDKYLSFCGAFLFWGLGTSLLLCVVPYENNTKMIPLLLLALAVLISYGLVGKKKKMDIKPMIASVATVIIGFVILSFFLPKTTDHILKAVNGIRDKDVFASGISSIPNISNSNVVVDQTIHTINNIEKYQKNVFLDPGQTWISEKSFPKGTIFEVKINAPCVYLDSSENGYVKEKPISGTKYITKTSSGTISFYSSVPTRIEISQYN